MKSLIIIFKHTFTLNYTPAVLAGICLVGHPTSNKKHLIVETRQFVALGH